jgi:hypothetical protein
MLKIVLMAHVTNITSVIHDIVQEKQAKVSLMS